MIEVEKKEQCSGCGACANKCPYGAIDMMEDDKGFLYPKVNKEKCSNCEICNKICPIINKNLIANNPIAYACYNKNEEIRLKSSSGGIFTLVAEAIIKHGGVVFGAIFDTDFSVKHSYAETIEELEKFRTSKYLQSRIENTYKEAEEFLKQGREVLFTGTPCQIEGLITFLGKMYDNLYTQDIICHGVPSPKVWQKYLNFIDIKFKETNPLNVNFRQKDNGWSVFSILINYKKSEYNISHKEDMYMRAFLKNVILRDSCYECSFKKKSRLSDITLADFWGIDEVLPEFNDNRGISLVIINSNRGEKLFTSIIDNIISQKVNLEDAIKYNASMLESAMPHKNREKVFKDLESMEFDILIKKYVKDDSKIKKIANEVIRICKKFRHK